MTMIRSGPSESSIASVEAQPVAATRVTERAEPRELPFEQIRDAARREWLHVRKVAASDALYEKLRSRYVVEVEPRAAAEKLAGAAQ